MYEKLVPSFEKHGDREGVVEDALSCLIRAGHLSILAERKCAGCTAHDGRAGGRANDGENEVDG